MYSNGCEFGIPIYEHFDGQISWQHMLLVWLLKASSSSPITPIRLGFVGCGDKKALGFHVPQSKLNGKSNTLPAQGSLIITQLGGSKPDWNHQHDAWEHLRDTRVKTGPKKSTCSWSIKRCAFRRALSKGDKRKGKVVRLPWVAGPAFSSFWGPELSTGKGSDMPSKPWSRPMMASRASTTRVKTRSWKVRSKLVQCRSSCR